MAAPMDLFVAPAALQTALDDVDVQVVAVDTPENFAAEHIPGARLLTMADFVSAQGNVGGLIPDDETLAARLTDAGLRSDAHIVAYDRSGDSHAARLLYTLDVVGHDAFSLLDGGLTAWQAAGLALETGEPALGGGDFRIDARRDERVADRAWIDAHRSSNDVRLWDVRSHAEFIGEDVRSARGGHIPGAVNLDWQQLKDGNGQLRDLNEIRDLLVAHDLDPSREVATYCQTHMRSSYTYLVLKALGYEQIRGYPGAWSDWGNAAETEIETGA